MKIAAVFPGQGSQSVGMGGDIAKKSDAAKAIFDRANAVLGYDLFALMQDGPEEKLRETQFSQPAIFVTNLAMFEAVRDFVKPIVSAGHSFAEFCSLTIAGALSFEEALHVVNERGRAMQAAAEQAPGGMSAVLGYDAEGIRRVVDSVRTQSGARIQLANFNSPQQIVISGDLAAVQRAGELLLEAGAKRVVPLNVSGAWHSALMDPAVAPFGAAVIAAHIELPKITVISNVDAQPYESVDQIRKNLIASITSEVRWHETAERLVASGVDMVVEFGGDSRGVLAPLMKRMGGAFEVANVSDGAGVEKLRSKVAVTA